MIFFSKNFKKILKKDFEKLLNFELSVAELVEAPHHAFDKLRRPYTLISQNPEILIP